MKTNEKYRMKNFAFCILPFALLLISGCAYFQVGGEVQQGRMELLYGDPKIALAHFQRAADIDPDYRLHYSIFPEWVGTYLGRAYYAAGRLPEARRALERARANERDHLAKLYLGVVLAQDGERARGLREMEAGLQGVVDWYDWVEFYHTEGKYWDPGKYLRKAIQKQIAALKGGDAGQDLIQNAAYLGREIEIEIDKSRQHKHLDLYRDGGADPRSKTP